MTYNGWSNYETWAVKLWLDNEEADYRYWIGETDSIARGNTSRGAAISDLAEMLKREHEEALPELSGFAANLLTSAFRKVEWWEIAKALIDDWAEENPDQAIEEWGEEETDD